MSLGAPWDRGFGDEREPLGLKYAARYFQGAGFETNWIVWRASATVPAGTYAATFLKDLTTSQTGTTGSCSSVEPASYNNIFYDEDENTVTVNAPLPSPLPPPSGPFFGAHKETQKINVGTFPRPTGAVAGWASLEIRFLTSAPNGTVLDQAWIGYEYAQLPPVFPFFLSAAGPATPLDPSTCNPLGIPVASFSTGVNGPIAPVIPAVSSAGPPQ